MANWKDRKDDRAYTVDIFFDIIPLEVIDSLPNEVLNKLSQGPPIQQELITELFANYLERHLLDALEGMCEIDLDASELGMSAGSDIHTLTFYGDMSIEMTCAQAHRQGRDLIEAVIPNEILEKLNNWDVVPDPDNPADY